MGVGGSLLGLSLACATASVEDTGFQVVSSSPADGEEVVGDIQPELRLNAAADTVACDGQGLGLVALRDDGTVVFEVETELVPRDSGRKLSFRTADGLLAGYSYGYAIQTGACLDTAGRPLLPWPARFTVPR